MTAKRKSCLAATILAGGVLAVIGFGFVRALTPRDVSKEDPESVFREFVCDPIPLSVSDVKADGIIAFAGGNVVVDFTVDDRDRAILLRRGQFTRPDKSDSEWTTENDPFAAVGGSIAFVHVGEGMKQITLYLAKNGNRARLHYISY